MASSRITLAARDGKGIPDIDIEGLVQDAKDLGIFDFDEELTLTPADRMLRELGVTEPNEIDLETIAWTQGVHVRYRPLHGCEARVLGANDRAVVAINSSSPPRRRRFSLAHELGHWHHHRGKTLFCRADDIGGNRGATQVERVANGSIRGPPATPAQQRRS